MSNRKLLTSEDEFFSDQNNHEQEKMSGPQRLRDKFLRTGEASDRMQSLKSDKTIHRKNGKSSI